MTCGDRAPAASTLDPVTPSTSRTSIARPAVGTIPAKVIPDADPGAATLRNDTRIETVVTDEPGPDAEANDVAPSARSPESGRSTKAEVGHPVRP